MNYNLQNALVGLISIASLYGILAVVQKVFALYIEVYLYFRREKDMELVAKLLTRNGDEESK